MKLVILLLLIAIDFSFADNRKRLFPRKLDEDFGSFKRRIENKNDGKKKLMLVGFGITIPDSLKYDFIVYFKKFGDFLTYNYLNLTFSYKDEQTKSQNSTIANCTYETETKDKRDLQYNCKFFVDGFNSSKIQTIKNFEFYNTTDKIFPIKKTDIVESSLFQGNSIEDYIIDNFDTFYLDEIEQKKNLFILKGNINSSSTIDNQKPFNLKLKEKQITCNVSQNEIIFTLNESIEDTLQGKILSNEDEKKILIFADEGVYDSIIYPLRYQFVELIGFENYKKEKNSNAIIFAYLSGDPYSLNNLGDYMRFSVKIELEGNQKIFSANGTRVGKTIINDSISYIITIYDTKDINPDDISAIYALSDYEFSDNRTYYTKAENFIISFPEDQNIKGMVIQHYNPIKKISDKAIQSSNSLSLDFEGDNIVDIKNNSKAYMSFIPMGSLKRKEIECSVENIIKSLKILCKPKEDVFTYINTLRFNITDVSDKKLRLLETKSTLFKAPPQAEGTIEYIYEPQFNYFGKSVKSNKGLSAGAIIAIVFGAIVAIAAVVLAIFFFGRAPKPSNKDFDLNQNNSSININK